MSTFLTAAAAAVLKSPAASGSCSSPYSTLSETSSTSPPRRICTTSSSSSNSNKRSRTRTPRKRPNQTYSEAAALLSAVYPKLFSPNKLWKHAPPFHSLADSSTSDLLPAFPALSDAGFLIGGKPSFRIEPRPVSSCRSSTGSQLLQPASPGGTLDDHDDDGFDAESILVGESGEGIDSIMGNLSMSTNEVAINSNCNPINPFFRALMGFRLGGELELGLRRALRRHVDDAEQWSSLTVADRDIIPKFRTLSENEKKKKKVVVVVKEEMKELPHTTAAATAVSTDNWRPSLLLKLNYEEVANDWSGHGSPFYGDDGAPESSGHILARLAEIVPSPEEASSCADGVREASVMRYKEKRRSRLFSKKIRYQVRKVNAEQRPRMKGRFAKTPSLLQEAMEEVGQ